MPAIRMLGRRWSFATDDVPMLGFFPTLFHGLWALVLVIIWIVFGKHRDCYDGTTYTVVLAGLLATFTLFTAVGCWTIYEGLKGSMFETGRRWRVPHLIYLLAVIMLAEIAFNGYATWFVEQRRPDCAPTRKLWNPQDVGRAICWTTWAIIGALVAVGLMVFNAFPDYNSQHSWERRCHCLMVVCCCNWFSGHRKDQARPAYAAMGELFSQLFGNVDWAPSDLVTAFLLAGAAQNARRRVQVAAIVAAGGPGSMPSESRGSPGLNLAPSSRAASMCSKGSTEMMLAEGFLEQPVYDVESGIQPLITPSGIGAEMRRDLTPQQAASLQCAAVDHVSDKDVVEAAYFAKYAFAAYGYMLYIWSKPQLKGWCELCCGRGCGFCVGPFRRYQEAFSAGRYVPTLQVSNYMNHEAIVQITDIPEDDIVFVRFEADVIAKPCLPYFIALDRQTSSVVISIRGTLSADDLITDFMCEPADMDDWMSTVTTPHAGQGQGSHDPHLSVGSSAGTGFFSRRSSSQQQPAGRQQSASRAERSASQRASAPERLPTVQSGVPGLTHRPSKGMASRRQVAGEAEQGGKELDEYANGQSSGQDHDRNEKDPVSPGKLDRDFTDSPPAIQHTDSRTKASAHSGILRAAKGVVEDIVQEGVLAALMEGKPVPPSNRRTPDCRNWQIVATGHSLGAGAAALVALYIRSFYPRSRAWAFEPPGGLVDGQLARASSDCITSVVLGKDWVPRLSVASFERLRDEMVVAGLRCCISKTAFLLGMLMGKRWAPEELFTSEAGARPEASHILSTMSLHLQRSSNVARRYESARSFRPPGRLMFLRPVKHAAQVGQAKRSYDAVWLAQEDLVEEGILVSPRMMADHMPDYLTALLKRMAEERASKSGSRQGPTQAPSVEHAMNQGAPSKDAPGGKESDQAQT
ncbi:hypothetical protein CVIRNUC_010068 [Coccomyxa viridis]|uniref:sn-1-specific diacylglycerol lipase n=1 Tax=Coccomyxa viridis TaxID=1274662 RepID=A0AAV1IHQ0_9CHLO|nr:hypothetical protein CVIRNUC_010068 [Coccomyxa viridis]